MNYVKKALYDEMLSFYHTTLGMEHEDRLRLRGQIGHLVRVARKEIPDTLETKAKFIFFCSYFMASGDFIVIQSRIFYRPIYTSMMF